MRHIANTASFFTSLGVPLPGFNAHPAAEPELFGGILLIVGLATRLTGVLLAGHIFVAYWTADREALTSVFADPGKFYVADPFTFLFASFIVLIFGADVLSLDYLVTKRMQQQA